MAKRSINALMGKLSPQNAIMEMAKNMFPTLEQNLKDRLEILSRPREEGGILIDGFERATYMLTTYNDELKILLVCMKQTGQGILLSNPVQILNLADLVNLNADGK